MSRLAVLLPVLAVACGGARTNPNSGPNPNGDPVGSVTRTDDGSAGGRALTAISPSSGSIAGGTQVVLTGAGFDDTMFATFAGRNCNGLDVLSPTEARCFTPLGDSAGPVDVEVVWLDGVAAALPGGFNYVGDSGSTGDGGSDDGGGSDGGGGGGEDGPVADRPPAPPVRDVFLVRPAVDSVSRAGVLLNVEVAAFWVGVTPVANQGPEVALEIGVGPTDADPSAAPDAFVWSDASYVHDGDGTQAGGVATHDHYQANLSADPGTYRIAVRAQMGIGEPILYGDVSGLVDGFDPAELPNWTVNP